MIVVNANDRKADDDTNELTSRIIGAAIEVHRNLGPQLLERVYEDALSIELGMRDISYVRQKEYALDYKGRPVGTFIVDLLVEDRVIVELKSVANLAPVHQAQLIHYLKVAKLKRGLLLNFGKETMRAGIKRISV